MSEPHDKRSGFLEELKRRRVVRAIVGYGASVFVVLQAADIIFEALDVPGSYFRILVYVALAGFPLAIILGWLLDVTPEGVRLTARPGEGGRLLARIRPWAIYTFCGALALIALGAAVLVNLPRAASGAVARGADVIAVLPFEVSGGVEDMSTGVVDLLTRNLDFIGSVRTADARTVRFRWDRRKSDGQTTLADAIGLARDVNAGSVLIGNIVALGPQVRIDARLVSLDSTELASAEVQGSTERMFELVDSLSVKLLTGIWRARSPVPRVNVRAITSGNLEAIRAFVRGEEHYRASAWDSASIWFGRAIAEDSMFPLAHYRYAMTFEWGAEIESGRQAAAEGSPALALRYADRLPPREQALVRVMAMRRANNPSASDTLRSYLERYPDDAEAWFLLADAEYHLRDELNAPLGRRPEELLVLFDRVLALDPSFTPAFIHPLEVAFRADTALARQYADLLATVVPNDPGTALYRLAQIGLASRNPTLLGEALTLAIATGDSTAHNLARQAAAAVTRPLILGVALLDATQRDSVLTYTRRRLAGEHRDAHARVEAELLTAAGRSADARRLVVALAGRMPDDARSALDRLPITGGYADSTAIARLAAPTTNADRTLLRMFAAIDAGDADGAHRAALTLRDIAPADWTPIVEAGAAFAQALSGDTIAGLAAVQTTLPTRGFAAGSAYDALWFRWTDLLSRSPQTRTRALEILNKPWPGAAVFEVQRQFLLGRTLEAAGDEVGARAAYSRFIAAVTDAESSSPIGRRLEIARAAVARMRSGPPAVRS